MKVTPTSRKKSKGKIRKVGRTATKLPDARVARLRSLAALVDFSPDLIAVISPARRVLFWSKGAAAATGSSAKEAKGRDFFGLLNIAGDSVLEDAFERVATGGEWEGEFGIVTRDGSSRTLRGRWKFMTGGRGTAGSVLLVNRDITELKQVQAAATAAQRLDEFSELACTMAHELNNVLAPITIGADVIESKTLDSESAEMLQLIRENAERARQLVRQVLLIVRGQDQDDFSPESDAAAKQPAAPARANGELVIVADDEPVIADLCRTVLEDHGYRVEVAVDGVEALALFGQHRAAVRAVISDMAMPFMDGVDLTRAIRRLEPTVPILIATGSADGTPLRVIEDFAFVSVLPKPYTQRSLIEALQRCLSPAAIVGGAEKARK